MIALLKKKYNIPLRDLYWRLKVLVKKELPKIEYIKISEENSKMKIIKCQPECNTKKC